MSYLLWSGALDRSATLAVDKDSTELLYFYCMDLYLYDTYSSYCSILVIII